MTNFPLNTDNNTQHPSPLYNLFKKEAHKEGEEERYLGSFPQDFVCKLASYLLPEEVVDLSETCKGLHGHLSMRTPIAGAHPLLSNESSSPLEAVFYAEQADFIHQECRGAKRNASRKLRLYLPLHNNAPFLDERRQIREQYRNLRSEVAELGAKMALLEINRYLQPQQKVDVEIALRARYTELQAESLQLEQQVLTLLSTLMDDRMPQLRVRSEFFE